MTVDAALDLARSYGVEVRLNAAGDGLRLEFDDDPPEALVNVLRRTKWDIVAALRQHEIDRRRPLITGWINDHFVPRRSGSVATAAGARGKATSSSACTAATTAATFTPPVSQRGGQLQRLRLAPR